MTDRRFDSEDCLLALARLALMASVDNVPVSLFLASTRTGMLPIRMWGTMESMLDVRIAAVSGTLILCAFMPMRVTERLTGLTRRCGADGTTRMRLTAEARNPRALVKRRRLALRDRPLHLPPNCSTPPAPSDASPTTLPQPDECERRRLRPAGLRRRPTAGLAAIASAALSLRVRPQKALPLSSA